MMQAVLNHLWQSSVFAAGAGILTLVLRGNSAKVRYWIWLAASIKFLLPFSVLVDAGSRVAVRRTTTQSPVATVVEQVSRPFGPAVSTPGRAPAVVRTTDRTPMVLAAVWGAGFFGVIFYWSRRWIRVLKDVRSASPIDMPLPIPVRSSPALLEPGAFGLFHSVLLLPAGIAERMSSEQLNAIIAHEMCHVRRRDNLWSVVHMVVEASFWFHPLVWWIGARLIDERERACDEEVLRSGTEPEIYAEGILNVCKSYVVSPLVCVAGVTGADLKKRVAHIMRGGAAHSLDFARKALLVAAGLVTVAGPVAVGLFNAPRTFAQTNTSQYTFGLTTVADRAFEVASVKPGPPGEDGWQLGVPTRGGIRIDNMELHKIIASSFRIQDSQVAGPAWIDNARYTIEAKGSDPTVGNPVVFEMLRHLLAERFQLKYHIEGRQRPIYALTVAKGGHKLTRPEDGVCKAAIQRGEHCANLRFGLRNLGITNMPVQALLGGIGRIMPDRPVVDQTGLSGFYDVDVKWEQEEAGGLAPRVDTAAMIIAMEEQAGLKLEAKTGKVDFLVIDSVEKPKDN